MGALFKIFELVDHSMLASRYLIIDIRILLSTMKKFVVLKFKMKIQQGTSMKKKFHEKEIPSHIDCNYH